MSSRQLQALVLTHVPFEDLGSLEPVLRERDFAIETIHVPITQFPLAQGDRSDLLIVMGGPIGVYESTSYPFLDQEIACIRSRLVTDKPILGICLGAQLLAAAAGGKVYPGSTGPEIGWAPIEYSGAAMPPAWFQPLLANGLPVFHWHGDTFDLPPGARPLAKTNQYENQAFTIGKHALALQFHPEVTAAGLERWYVGHAFELAKRGISVEELRAVGIRQAPTLEEAAKIFWNAWLDYIL